MGESTPKKDKKEDKAAKKEKKGSDDAKADKGDKKVTADPGYFDALRRRFDAFRMIFVFVFMCCAENATRQDASRRKGEQNSA